MQNHNTYWSPLLAVAFLLTATLGIAATPVLALLLLLCVAISTSADYIFSEGSLQRMLKMIQARYLLATPISRDFEFTFAGASLHLFGQFSLLVGDVLLFMAFLGVQHPQIGLKQRIIKLNSAALGDSIRTLIVRTAVLLSPVLLSFLMVYSNNFRLSVASSIGILPALAYPLLACISLSFMLAAAISAAQILNKVRTNGEQK